MDFSCRGAHAPRHRELFPDSRKSDFGEGAENCTRGRVRSPDFGTDRARNGGRSWRPPDYLAATSDEEGLIVMLPAPERSMSDFPPPFIFPFIESRSVRVPVKGCSLVTRPELASASISRPASGGTCTSMLPADVSRSTSPGTGDLDRKSV